jgi:DNA-binding GntR family transcriptional regulator
VGSTDGTAFADLEQARGLLGRTSTAERVASILRDRILEGSLPPSTRLPEDLIGQALGVSRNTLREAFRVLSHERLLVHQLNRGVFVRRLTADDLVDLYRVRRLVEVAAVRANHRLDDAQLRPLREAVEEGQTAAKDDRWVDVGTANIHFHLALGGLAGSPRVDAVLRQFLAELRLVFHVRHNPREFHEPYLERNREILTLLEAGDIDAAARALETYLHVAERQILTVLAASEAPAHTPR